MAQYPSQAMHNIMGGALHPVSSSSLTTQHGRTDLVSRHPHPQATSRATSKGGKEGDREGSERDRALKRKLESQSSMVGEKRSEEGGLYDVSGLSKSQRVAAFLSTSSDAADNLSVLSAASSEQEPPLKKKARERAMEERTDKTISVAKQGSTSMEKIPIPNEGYFPVHQLPPLQVGA